MTTRLFLLKSILILALLMLPSFMFSQDMVTVLDFKAEGGVSDYEAETLRKLFETELIRSGRYTVIEKADQNKVIEAQKESLHGCVDDACAVEIGKLLSADRILIGSAAKIGQMSILTVKMINIETGRSERAENILADSIEGLIERMSILVGLLSAGDASAGIGRIIYENESPSDKPTDESISQVAETNRAYVVIKSDPPGATFTLKNDGGTVLR